MIYMGFRVRGRIKVCKGVYINVGKKGITSVSAKVGGTTINRNRKGRVKATTRVCKGVSYETTLKQGKRTQATRKTTTSTRKPTKKELEQMRIAQEQQKIREQQERERQEQLRKEREEQQRQLELQRNLDKLNLLIPTLQNNFTRYNEMVNKFDEQIEFFRTIDETDMTTKQKIKLMKKDIRLCNRLEIHMNTIDRQIQQFLRLCDITGAKNTTDFTEWHEKKVNVRQRLNEFRTGLRHNLWDFRLGLLLLPFKLMFVLIWGLIQLLFIVLTFPFMVIKEMIKGNN